jgi:hypothetical protein
MPSGSEGISLPTYRGAIREPKFYKYLVTALQDPSVNDCDDATSNHGGVVATVIGWEHERHNNSKTSTIEHRDPDEQGIKWARVRKCDLGAWCLIRIDTFREGPCEKDPARRTLM